MRPDGHIRHILIVGGGTAGWLAASHLARRLRATDPEGVAVTLLESPDIPIIGVGEGTVPAFRQTLKHLGIRETDFIRECDATFKQSIRFVDWVHNPGSHPTRAYHHVFDYPAVDGLDPTPYWLMGAAGDKSYVDAVSVQGQVIDQHLGPKLMTQPEYEGITNYAYHLDAPKLAAFLMRHATEKLGVKHILANVTGVEMAESGDIAAVETDRAGRVDADLFVDCTGFSAKLIEGAMGVRFVPKSDVLFCEHALAVQVPYASPDEPLPSCTHATALDAGWVWDIGLTDRRGTGYVYSSAHTSHEAAEAALREYLRPTIGKMADEVTPRRIPMRIGMREKFWQRNCVAIGLSQGFVEPLEATGILVYDVTARMLAEQMPGTRAAMDAVASRFNERVRYGWDRVIDFIKLHYCLTKRTDSDFWQDNRCEDGIPEHLAEQLAVWRHQPPTAYDFATRYEIFNLENYLYVLYGMEFETDMVPLAGRYGEADAARRLFDDIGREARELCGELLPHRELIARIKRYGLQTI
ncbi:tryptophan halogenase family protein [Pseudokordiimonas caeni]|uniref:tryptophan halogenase family protein n=1 Tax=Pseudokordiimonas caeni TaxID=2997908 RepID=UPI00281204B4|nr:tryptophan 7-halogenase [Pseudokordiimonas caeni]